MPFIVQCPQPACKKYMLLEDSMRGAKVECLVCKRSMEVDSPAPESHKIVTCPACKAQLRLPPSHQPQPIRCPECGHGFTG